MAANTEKNCVPVETMRSITLSLIRDMAPLTSSWGGWDEASHRLASSICALGRNKDFFTSSLPRIGKFLDKELSGNCCKSRDERLDEIAKITQDPSLFDWYFRVIIVDRHVDPRAWAAVRFVRQVCYLFYKLRGGEHPSTHQLTLDEFVRRDAELEFLDFDNPKDFAFFDVLRQVCHKIFGSFDASDITPRHGPGAVATGEKPWQKMNFHRFIARLDKEYPFTDYFHLNSAHLCDNLHSFLHWEECDPSAKIVLVPKDSRGPRIISAEPLEFQWIQQGIMRSLVNCLEKHHLTAGHVWFTNQLPNQEQARQGSLSSDLSTLDLKDASDRVSLKLLEKILPKQFYRKIAACRSLSTKLPDGRTVTLRKFAPMGSALCFPIMATIVFATVVTARLLSRRHSIHISLKEMYEGAKDVTVFGDDLIIPTRDYSLVAEALSKVGLMLNLDKCCTGPFFRESCGADWFRGQLVTPLRIKTLFPGDKSPEGLLSTIAYANAFAKIGFDRTAHLLGRMAENIGPLPRAARLDDVVDLDFSQVQKDNAPLVLFCADGKRAYKENCKMFKNRFNPNLHRNEFLVPCVTNEKLVIPSGWGEYFRWHVNHAPECLAHRYTVPHRIKIRKRWTSL